MTHACGNICVRYVITRNSHYSPTFKAPCSSKWTLKCLWPPGLYSRGQIGWTMKHAIVRFAVTVPGLGGAARDLRGICEGCWRPLTKLHRFHLRLTNSAFPSFVEGYSTTSWFTWSQQAKDNLDELKVHQGQDSFSDGFLRKLMDLWL